MKKEDSKSYQRARPIIQSIPYNIVEMQDKTRFESVHQSDFGHKKPQNTYLTQKQLQSEYKKCHFEFKGAVGKYQSLTHQIFSDPSGKAVDFRAAGGNGLGVTRLNDNFSYTVNNTVGRYHFLTRYPYQNQSDTYQTTVSNAYKGEPVDKRNAILPVKSQVEDYIHPSSSCVQTEKGVEFKTVRELSTVSRRSYVAPEVMRDAQQITAKD